MKTIEILGNPASSYVRSALWACFEKGGEPVLAAADLQSSDYRALHPFAKMPVLRHGDVTLFETSAIVWYLDAALDGAPLVPGGPADAARVVQWTSAFVDYGYRAFIPGYALRYVFPAGPEGAPDREAIEAAVPRLRDVLAVADAAYSQRPWIAGDTLSAADILWLPALDTVRRFPEGEAAVADHPHAARALRAASERPAWRAVAALGG